MTQGEANKKSSDKLKKINTMLQEMQVFPEAKQRVNEGGFIENVVVFNDVEQYNIDPLPTPVVRGPAPENVKDTPLPQ